MAQACKRGASETVERPATGLASKALESAFDSVPVELLALAAWAAEPGGDGVFDDGGSTALVDGWFEQCEHTHALDTG
jgi:hypothetical protein